MTGRAEPVNSDLLKPRGDLDSKVLLPGKTALTSVFNKKN